MVMKIEEVESESEANAVKSPPVEVMKNDRISSSCSNCDGDGFAEEESEEESELEEVESEESELENAAVKSPPVEVVKDLSYYFPEEEPESEEEVLGDSDREEKDYGDKFVVKKRSRTVTNPKLPQKIYFRRNGPEQRISTTNSVLHDPDFPVASISKLALKTYNKIQKTKYKYVGLVKAYSQPVNGFYIWTRFKARLRGQDAIYFQASTFQERQDPESNVVYVRFESVYPLPPSLGIHHHITPPEKFTSDVMVPNSVFPPPLLYSMILYDPGFPVAAISKLALKTYNKIQKTKYKYVGLVKAYKRAVNGFHFWTRFKARLRGQDAIYFQAIIFQERRDPESNVVFVRFESVYPLPPS